MLPDFGGECGFANERFDVANLGERRAVGVGYQLDTSADQGGGPVDTEERRKRSAFRDLGHTDAPIPVVRGAMLWLVEFTACHFARYSTTVAPGGRLHTCKCVPVHAGWKDRAICGHLDFKHWLSREEIGALEAPQTDPRPRRNRQSGKSVHPGPC